MHLKAASDMDARRSRRSSARRALRSLASCSCLHCGGQGKWNGEAQATHAWHVAVLSVLRCNHYGPWRAQSGHCTDRPVLKSKRSCACTHSPVHYPMPCR